MTRKIAAKLRSRAGESIGETLAALLISSLALLMLAGAISSATKIVTRSMDTIIAYNDGDKAIVSRDSSEDAAADSGRIGVSLENVSSSGPELLNLPAYTGTYYANSALGGKAVVSYVISDDDASGGGN